MKDKKNGLPIYHAFGLNIKSELPSTPLFGMTPVCHAAPDVVIRLGNVPFDLENANYRDQYISYHPGKLILRIQGLARYLIAGGKEISIQIEPNAKEGDVATIAFGSAIGTLLYQRHIFALHGSAVRTSKGAVIFSGVKGAGKSTIAAALAARGWEFMSDDICAIHFENEKALLYPGLSRAKLTYESYVNIIGGKPDNPPISPFLDKYGAAFKVSLKPSPIKAICLLEASGKGLNIELIKGAERLKLLTEQIYRPLIHQLIESPVQQFRQYSAISSQTSVLRISRALDFGHMNSCLQFLEDEVLS